ncbi:elongation factor Ts [Candidatus Falkowbacteria bacterium]|nr:elongation factor Ts [Candidatus Falkowbacteria bacterium]
MSIDIKIISQLREQTGAGIGDCQKALEEAGGDLTKAVEILRKSGEIKAAKKSDRSANEGVIAIARSGFAELSRSGQKAAVVVLNCETDFVARNDDFIKTADKLTQKLLESNIAEFGSWAEAVIKNELIVKIGENIKLGKYEILLGEVIGSYLHANKKVAAVVVLSGGSDALAGDIAMQVAAMNPFYLDIQDIPLEVLEKEKEIYREQLKQQGKPENIWDKIIEGKLAKYYEDNCLLKQVFIKDEEKKIADLLGDAQVISFKRFRV